MTNCGGAQTQRSLEHFQIGREQFVWSASVIRALGWVKKAAALSNRALGQMPAEIADAIVTACDEVIADQLDAHFPLVIFQTGSGTQTNMNANEVIANRAIQLLGGALGSKNPVHPNDHVNCSQSSNDVFPTVMHVAIAHELFTEFLPKIAALRQTFSEQSAQFMHIVKTGRSTADIGTRVFRVGRAIGWCDGWFARQCAELVPLGNWRHCGWYGFECTCAVWCIVRAAPRADDGTTLH